GAAVVYGDAWWVDAEGSVLRPYPARAFDRELLQRECFICQPAAFVRREVFEQVGLLDPALSFTFDYDLWLRIAQVHTMQKLDGRLALSRMHAESKTLGHRRQVFRETLSMLQRNCGYVPFSWVYSYVCHAVDGRDQFFEPLRPSIFKYLLSLPVGIRQNLRRPIRYCYEWMRVMSWQSLKRYVKLAGPDGAERDGTSGRRNSASPDSPALSQAKDAGSGTDEANCTLRETESQAERADKGG
ncbi:MAG: hypothetical protein ACRD9L_16625, partial [Bryobacteraceae bacterium]